MDKQELLAFHNRWEAYRREKGIILSYDLRNRFNRVMNSRCYPKPIRDLGENRLTEFRRRIGDVFERLDSIGFVCHVMCRELKELVTETYRPGKFPGTAQDDFVVGVVDATTVRYAVEALLVFSVSYLEFFGRAFGFLFKNPNVRKIDALVNTLEQYGDDTHAQALLAALRKYDNLWQELQQDGFRDRLRNAMVGVDTYKSKTLRSVVIHYRALRLSDLQIETRNDGSVHLPSVLEPGAWSHEDPNCCPDWGQGKGIVRSCLEMRDELRALLSDVSDAVLC